MLKSDKNTSAFDSADFLAKAGLGRKVVELEPKETSFCQGDPADTIFYLRKGRAKLTVVSHIGKEATITLIAAGDFVGEECLASIPGLRLSTASAVNSCAALKITRVEMACVMHDEPSFADCFLKFLLTRSVDGRIRQAGRERHVHSPRFTRDPGGNDWHHEVPCKFLYESISEARLHQLQRPHSGQ